MAKLPPPKEDRVRRAPAVHRALAILRLVAKSPVPLGVSDIARAIGASKGTVHGIIQVLKAEDALEQVDGTKKFRLGPLAGELARCRDLPRRLDEVCGRHLGRLAELSGQTAILGVPEGSKLLIETARQGGGAFRVVAAPGMRIPLLAGAAGKVALAWGVVELPRDLPRFTDRSPRDPGALEEEAARVRREGVAFDRGEYLQGVAAAAAPLLLEGRLVGILYAVGFWDELGEPGLQKLGRWVREAADTASRDLCR